MKTFLEKIRALVRAGDVRLSEHGYDELAEDGLTAREALGGVLEAIIVEDYPDFPKGSCALLFQKDSTGKPVHVVWGIPNGHDKPRPRRSRPRPTNWPGSCIISSKTKQPSTKRFSRNKNAFIRPARRSDCWPRLNPWDFSLFQLEPGDCYLEGIFPVLISTISKSSHPWGRRYRSS